MNTKTLHKETPAISQVLLTRYHTIRQQTVTLCEPLHTEDYVIQPEPDASPPAWHLAHTTWFFETFVLLPHIITYRVWNKTYNTLYNSYYEGAGTPWPRHQRGILARPGVEEIMQYRNHVDQAIELYLITHSIDHDLNALITLGLHHEQQHQELLLTDIKATMALNPMEPCYLSVQKPTTYSPPETIWLEVEGGLHETGALDNGFSFDNEKEPHLIFLRPFNIMNRLITNEEYLQFIKDEGYQQHRFWHADGFTMLRKQGITTPRYWRTAEDNSWQQYNLRGGWLPLQPDAPVTHISYYEASAYATWRGMRLPSEAEWEAAARQYSKEIPLQANMQEDAHYHPMEQHEENNQFFGDCWEWTTSAYLPYTGFQTEKGTVGEYNGKFMSGQMVLRGGSCATPRNHIRHSYRNFFQPEKRWQFTGIRLSHDI